MADEETNEILASFPTKRGFEIRVVHNHWKGKDLIDVRVWVDNSLPPNPENWIATRKGITIRTELLGKLVEALQKATEKLAHGGGRDG